MGTDRLSLDKQQNQSTDIDEDLNSILEEYETLSNAQQTERQELLQRIDELTQRTQSLDNLDGKLEQFTSLLLDIRAQIAGITSSEGGSRRIHSPPSDPASSVVASDKEIMELSTEVERKSKDLNDEIDSLSHLLDKKKKEIKEKDLNIEELNDRLELLTDEKGRLASELEQINSTLDSWRNQLELLQKLAASDPRYRVIESLKKHGTLSDIQLAFTMGTSINQLRKYIDDLIDLKLVKKAPNGRFVWTGREFDPEL